MMTSGVCAAPSPKRAELSVQSASRRWIQCLRTIAPTSGWNVPRIAAERRTATSLTAPALNSASGTRCSRRTACLLDPTHPLPRF
jgi:hypothetical protein